MTWIATHKTLIFSLAGALWTLLSVINGAIKNPEAKSFLGVLLDIIAFVSRGGAEGSVKVPLMQRSKSPNKLNAPVTSSASVTAILPLLLMMTYFVACAHVKAIAIDFGACELGKVPSTVVSILPDVNTALGGDSPNWEGDLKTIGLRAGEDAVQCAIASIIHELSTTHAALTPVGKRKLERGQIYLNKYRAVR